MKSNNLLRTILYNNIYFFKLVYEFNKSYVISQALIALINGTSPLLFMIMPKLIIDEIVNGKSLDKIITYILLYTFIQLIISITRIYLQQKFINLNGHLYAMHFLLIINKKVVTLDMAQLDDPATHQKLALAQDIIYKGIGINLINNFFDALSSIVLIISTTILISTADSRLVIVIVLFSLFTIFLNLKTENWRIKQRDENIYLTRVLNYYIRVMGDKCNSKEMKMFGFVEWLMTKYYYTLSELRVRLTKLYNISMKINIIATLAEGIKSNGIYFFFAWKTFNKQITIGQFTQYFSATNQLSTSLSNFIGFLTQLNIDSKYITCFREFMELESIIETSNSQMISSNELVSINTIAENNDILIRFEHVFFSYPGSDTNVLEDINCEFKVGKVYVIVGENGAGKSTLFNLICRLYEPTSGTIYMNNIPISKIDYHEYRNIFSVVFQDFNYFSLTIGENVALDQYDEKDEYKRSRILKYLNDAGLERKIKELPKGIDSPLDRIFDDDGIILSGGETQKLALSRALFRESPIIMLDEPSSALDPLAENDLLSKFKELAKSKMVIYISHRLTCASQSDQIIFIKNKTIYECGTHKELISNRGSYYTYYNVQAQHYKSQ